MYGAVDDRPARSAYVIWTVGILLFAAALGAFVYTQKRAERAKLAADMPVLSAEYDRLEAAAAPLRALATAARPETPPDQFARLTSTARAAIDAYRKTPRAAKLPSGRPWPGQFERTDTLFDESMKYFQNIGQYLAQRKKAAGDKPQVVGEIDLNIQAIAGNGTEQLDQLEGVLSGMRAQRDAREWSYEPAPRRRSAATVG